MGDIPRRILSVDKQLPTFIAAAEDITIGNNKSMLSLLNASSDKIVSIREIYIVNTTTSAVTGIIAELSLFRFTGHSGGTLITPSTMDTNDSLDVNITARTGSTITGEAANRIKHWEWSSDDWGTGTADVESNDHALQVLNPALSPQCGEMKPLMLRPGEGIHLKQVINSRAGSFDIYLMFTVE